MPPRPNHPTSPTRPHRTGRPGRRSRGNGRLGRRSTVAVALLALLAAGLSACTTSTRGQGSAVLPSAQSSASAATTPRAATPGVAFSDCSKLLDVGAAGIPSSRLKDLTFECGKVPVPLDYADPTGKTIDIEVVKVHDTQQKNPLGSLIINPGGPGESGLTTPIYLAAEMSNTILTHFDLVGFDPRGVGLSSPVECIPDADKDALAQLDPDVSTPAGFTEAKQADDEVISECTTKYATSIADYNTLYTAMDLDRIRIALGDKKLNYLGFSYGTALGWSYAHLYPGTIRTAVLDGAVDPTLDVITSLGDQLQGFEGAFDQFAADCETKPSCAAMGSPRQVVENLVAQANVSPLKSSNKSDPRTADGGIVLTAVLSALYSQSEWPDLASAIIAAQKGDARGLFELADEYNERNPDGTYSNILDANTAIYCNDQATRPTDAEIQAAATQWATQYPMFGVWGASGLFQCEDWPPSGHSLPSPAAPGSAPILVIGNTHDPATPYSGAQHLTQALTTGVLLTWQGEGHTSYLEGSSCVDDKVDAYFVNDTVPAAGTVCPP